MGVTRDITARHHTILNYAVARPTSWLFKAQQGSATAPVWLSVPVLFAAIPAAWLPLLRK
jgi:hypothetical protein